MLVADRQPACRCGLRRPRFAYLSLFILTHPQVPSATDHVSRDAVRAIAAMSFRLPRRRCDRSILAQQHAVRPAGLTIAVIARQKKA